MTHWDTESERETDRDNVLDAHDFGDGRRGERASSEPGAKERGCDARDANDSHQTLDAPSPHELGRREFTAQAVLALLSGVVITVTSGCGGDDSPTAPTPPGGGGGGGGGQGATGTVSANHGHTAAISSAQLTAGGAITLDIRGSADHPHTVELTAAEVTQIANRTRLSKSSSNDAGHSHVVTFN